MQSLILYLLGIHTSLGYFLSALLVFCFAPMYWEKNNYITKTQGFKKQIYNIIIICSILNNWSVFYLPFAQNSVNITMNNRIKEQQC